MKAVTFEALEKQFGGEALAVYKQICSIGGFGDVGAEFANGHPALDVGGLPDGEQAKIEKLLGKAPEDEAITLAKNTDRKKLLSMAKDAELDGNSYTDEVELARAILSKKENK